jgi:hypothetical protein
MIMVYYGKFLGEIFTFKYNFPFPNCNLRLEIYHDKFFIRFIQRILKNFQFKKCFMNYYFFQRGYNQ